MRTAALALLALGSYAFAGTINGTVTNKTTGKPSSGDSVSLLSLTGAMDEVGSAKTDATGHFTLKTPSDQQPFLIKVEHEKGAYFKNMPPGVSTADITVYDVAAKVEGVSTEADVLRVETDNGQLKITENYFVRNTSSPPRTQASDHTFEVVLPADATLEGAATVGPSNMPISATPDPVGAKGHYAFNFPIQPDAADKGTLFQIEYQLPYSAGKLTFHPQLTMPARTVWVVLPKSMTFAAGAGSTFQSSPQDPSFQTFLSRNALPSTPLEFTISGTGALPREDQGTQGGQQAGGQDGGTPDTSTPGTTPGGGIGQPIDTPDPLSKYKGWILGALALLMVATAAFLLRRSPANAALVGGTGIMQTPTSVTTAPAVLQAAPVATGNAALLNALKEELFTLENEKIYGKVTPAEYAQVKAALETVLKRALKRQ